MSTEENAGLSGDHGQGGRLSNNVTCPECKQSDQVEKVSTLYLTGLGLNRLPQVESSAAASRPRIISPGDPRLLSRRLAPPSGGKQGPTRPVHPDQIVLVFSLAAPIFMYAIYSSQPGSLLAVLAVLAVFYGFYFWQRKWLVKRYNQQRNQQRTAGERIQHGIDRWMRLYYCARDDGVFEPGSSELVPADQMPGYLLRE